MPAQARIHLRVFCEAELSREPGPGSGPVRLCAGGMTDASVDFESTNSTPPG